MRHGSGSVLFDMLDTVPFGAYVVDSFGTIRYWNGGARRILGYESNQVVGQLCSRVLLGLPSLGGGLVSVCSVGCPPFVENKAHNTSPVIHMRVKCSSGLLRMVALAIVLVPRVFGEEIAVAHFVRDESSSTEEAVDPLAGTDVDSAGGALPLGITAREVEVFGLLSAGHKTEEIALELGISRHTVLNHIRNCREKLNAPDRLGAFMALQKLGLL